MARIMFETDVGATILGAAPVSRRLIADALTLAPALFAADGGARKALGLHHPLRAVIGDLDSLTSAETWRKSGTEIVRISEQQTTDFEKCLYTIRAPLVIGAGFLGGRIDHQLAALGALVAHREAPVILIGARDAVMHLDRPISLRLPKRTRLSLMPLLPVTGTLSEGLRWPVAGLHLTPGGRSGVSNQTTGPQVRIGVDGPGCLLILPVQRLADMVRAARAAFDGSAR